MAPKKRPAPPTAAIKPPKRKQIPQKARYEYLASEAERLKQVIQTKFDAIRTQSDELRNHLPVEKRMLNVTAGERRRAEADYEDYLYHQNPLFRHQRRWLHRELKSGAQIQKYRLSTGDDESEFKKLRKTLDDFDQHNIGCAKIPDDNCDPAVLRSIGAVLPEKLHWETPTPKRQVRGSGVSKDESLGRELFLDLDLDAIEKRRKEVDDRRGATQENPEMTHTQRRANELAMKDVLATGNIALFARRHTRTDTGLWISAAETSEDWLTSYDQLGIVRTSFTRSEPMDSRHEHQQGKERSDNAETPAGQLPSVRTTWAEATPGRHERAVFERRAPSSPANSPPDSPLPSPPSGNEPTDPLAIDSDVESPDDTDEENDPATRRYKELSRKQAEEESDDDTDIDHDEFTRGYKEDTPDVISEQHDGVPQHAPELPQ